MEVAPKQFHGRTGRISRLLQIERHLKMRRWAANGRLNANEKEVTYICKQLSDQMRYRITRSGAWRENGALQRCDTVQWDSDFTITYQVKLQLKPRIQVFTISLPVRQNSLLAVKQRLVDCISARPSWNLNRTHHDTALLAREYSVP
jgi:hypothetical protein